MKGTTTQIGRYGEDLAAAHLIRNGFTVVRRNFRVARNEIDIIAENDGYLLFVEVKTRSAPDERTPSRYGRPSRAVTYDKRDRTLYAARAYLRDHPTKKIPRMDVMELYLQQEDNAVPRLLKLNWIQNAYRKQ
ncbi:MAG: YraN family protein [Clostridia bacterium]|nr:YraN family protein [Clostridia bacterium]